MIDTYIIAFLAAFIGVGLKSTQQLNVMHHKLLWIPPVSYGMALSEVLIIHSVSNNGAGWLVLWIGTGAWIGSITATCLHRRMRDG